MASTTLHYLTVQDILWINLQATKRVNHFSYAKLEEATFYQYAYGESSTLLPQAARFVTGFLKMHPLEEGNEVTAFIGLMAFLRVNGYDAEIADGQARTWFEGIASKREGALESLKSVARAQDHHDMEHSLDVRGAISSVLRDFPETISALTGASMPA